LNEPYHRFVFDTAHRRFVGDFETMYAVEDAEGFDSWYQDDDHLSRRLALAVLAGYDFERILDFGCGKGTFAARLKTSRNDVVGVDISPTAIAKATARHPECRWMVLGPNGLDDLREHFDLALATEVFSYLEDWRSVVARLSELAERLWITLYLPPTRSAS
jgi:predicted TPR repeat methyltransferase